jgi:hypothetical protein
MTSRLFWLLLLITLLVPTLDAKSKNRQAIPDYVLKAQTARVIVDPDAGEPLDQPQANATARDNVEKALIDWGRLRPVMEGMTSDLIIVVRTGSGKAMSPTIKGGPIDQRGGVAQGTDSSVRIGGGWGQNPSTQPKDPMDQSPHVSNELGPSEDSFVVYRGDVGDPTTAPAVWRYVAKDCLRAPQIVAVEEFRKALAEADKQQQSKKP